MCASVDYLFYTHAKFQVASKYNTNVLFFFFFFFFLFWSFCYNLVLSNVENRFSFSLSLCHTPTSKNVIFIFRRSQIVSPHQNHKKTSKPQNASTSKFQKIDTKTMLSIPYTGCFTTRLTNCGRCTGHRDQIVMPGRKCRNCELWCKEAATRSDTKCFIEELY